MLLPPLARPSNTTALHFPERSLTFHELRDAALDAAAAIDGATRVGVWAVPTAATVIGVVGALLAGVPVVPLNPRAGDRELTWILQDSSPDAIMRSPSTELPAVAAGHRRIDIAASGSRGRQLPREPDEETPALVVYTSGTTGAPKGAILSRRAIASNLDALAAAWHWTAADVVAHALPLFHVHGLVLGTLGPLRRGGRSHHLGRFSADAVVKAFHEHDATLLFAVPTMYHRLADDAVADPQVASALRVARLLVSGSAALSATDHSRIERACGQRIIERYGMTETLMNTAVRITGDRRPGTVGPALDGVELRLLDDAGRELVGDDETVGEIAVRGPNLFSGYLNRPDATAASLRDGWFLTGDLATLAPDGYVRIVGRRAIDLIKSGGFKIGAGEIEQVMMEHPAIDEVAVTSEPDDDLGERIVAWVVTRPGATPPAQELIDYVAAALAPHKRPRVVRFIDALPRNAMGKVQKTRLGD